MFIFFTREESIDYNVVDSAVFGMRLVCSPLQIQIVSENTEGYFCDSKYIKFLQEILMKVITQ